MQIARVAARARAAAPVCGADARRRRPARVACAAEAALCFLTWPAAEEFWIPLVDEPIGTIVAEIQEERPEIAKLVDSPRRLLAFRTFAYIRVGILLGRLLVENDVEPDEGATWAEQLAHNPEHRDEVVREVRRGGRGGRRRSRLRGRAARAERRGAGALLGVRQAPPGAEKGVTPSPLLLIMRGRWGSGSRSSWRWRGLLVLLTGAGGAGGAGSTAGASARAVAIRVVVPGQAGAEAGSISSPPYHAAFGSAFAYPTDGSVVSTGSISASASSDSGTAGRRRRDERGAVAQPLRRRDHGRPRSRAPRTARPGPRREGRLRRRDGLVPDGARLGGAGRAERPRRRSATGATSSRSSRAPTTARAPAARRASTAS